jgi:hypothetical protein
MHISNIVRTILELMVLNLTGLFFFKEILIYNLVAGFMSIFPLLIFKVDIWLYKVLVIIETVCFNLIDIHFSFSKEVNNTLNMVAIEKKSLALSQFVNRLLPKHI